jgi:hypothetical protein
MRSPVVGISKFKQAPDELDLTGGGGPVALERLRILHVADCQILQIGGVVNWESYVHEHVSKSCSVLGEGYDHPGANSNVSENHQLGTWQR